MAVAAATTTKNHIWFPGVSVTSISRYLLVFYKLFWWVDFKQRIHNITWTLYWTIRLEAMWSYYGYEITDRIARCLPDVLMSYQWQIKFCCCGSKIRDLIRNLQQHYSSFCDNINKCTINLFVFSNFVFRVSWVLDGDEGTSLHIKKPTCPGNEVVDLVTAGKVNCGR